MIAFKIRKVGGVSLGLIPSEGSPERLTEGSGGRFDFRFSYLTRRRGIRMSIQPRRTSRKW